MKNLKKIQLVITCFLIIHLSMAQFRSPGGYTSIGNSGAGNIEFIHNNPNGGLWLVRNNLSTFRSQISFKQGTATSNTEKLALGIDWNSNNTNDFFISQAGTPTAEPRFYIHSSGKFGFNTSNITSSSTLMTLVGGDFTIIETANSPYSTDQNGADIYMKDQYGGVLDISSAGNVGRIDAINSNNNLFQINKWGGATIIGQPYISPFPGSTLSFATAGSALINGSLAIGNPTSFTSPNGPFPSGYSLFVEKGLLTEKVKIAIKTTTDWSDFVFAPEYKLMPLDLVATYVKENKHLPDVPSAQEVVNNGIDVGKMDATLLQKIEELTLYVIELKKDTEKLKKENEQLKKEINNLK